MKTHANQRIEKTVPAGRPEDWLDRMTASTAPQLDLATIGKAVNDMIHAVAKQAEYLRKAKYRKRTMACPSCKHRLEVPGYDATAVAKASSHCGKVADELSRLSEFAQGRADSRPGGGSRDVLAELSDEGLAFVQALLRGDPGARGTVAAWRK